MKCIRITALALLITSILTSTSVSYAAEPEMLPSINQSLPELNVSQAETPKAIEDKLAAEITKVPDSLVVETTPITPDVTPMEPTIPSIPKTKVITVMEKRQIEVEKTIMEEVTVRDGKGILGWDSFKVKSYGSYSLPASFVINPSNGQFSSSIVYIENTGITDMILYAEAFKSSNWYSPTVVNPDTFRDWKNIGINDTYSYIALGLSIKDLWGNELCQYWFDDEWNQENDIIYWLSPDEAITVEIISKHGMCWFRPCTFSYECSIGVEVMPKKIWQEKKVKVWETIEVPVQIEVPLEIKDDLKEISKVPFVEEKIDSSILSQIEKAPDTLIVP